jgi:hypothetical protein
VKLALVSDAARFKMLGSNQDKVLASTIAIVTQMQQIYDIFPVSSGYEIRIQIVSFTSYQESWVTVPLDPDGGTDPSQLLTNSIL